MSTIRWSGEPGELEDRLAALPDALAGRIPDAGGAVAWLMVQVGLTLLGLLKEAYDTKSHGGTDAMGVKWPALAATTLALRTIGTGPKVLERLKEQLRTLGPEQRQQVSEHARKLARVLIHQDRAEKRQALRILERKHRAGTVTLPQYRAAKKRLEGKLTPDQAKKQVLAGAFALILRDKGGLFNSLSPVVGAPGQVLKTGPGWLEVGSNVQTQNGLNLLALHNSDKPRVMAKNGKPKLPRRQVLPDSAAQVPAEWWQRINETFQRGIASREFLLKFLGPRAS